jgi:hypothetical protein
MADLFLAFLVAIIQFFVFTLLVSFYTDLVCSQEGHAHWEEFPEKKNMLNMTAELTGDIAEGFVQVFGCAPELPWELLALG